MGHVGLNRVAVSFRGIQIELHTQPNRVAHELQSGRLFIASIRPRPRRDPGCATTAERAPPCPCVRQADNIKPNLVAFLAFISGQIASVSTRSRKAGTKV